MKTERMISMVRSMMQRNADKGEIAQVIQKAQALTLLQSDRIKELEREKARRQLKERYGIVIIKDGAK